MIINKHERCDNQHDASVCQRKSLSIRRYSKLNKFILVFQWSRTRLPVVSRSRHNKTQPEIFQFLITMEQHTWGYLLKFFNVLSKKLIVVGLDLCSFFSLLLTDANWIKWVLCTAVSNKPSGTFTSVWSNGVITDMIYFTSIRGLAFIKICGVKKKRYP